MLPTNKIDLRILKELQLALIKALMPLTKPGLARETGLKTPSLFPKPGLGNKAGPEGVSAAIEQEYNSI